MSRFMLMENLPDLVIASTTTVTMASSYLGKPTRVTIGGQQFLYTATTTLNFATTGLNALDTGAIAANTLYYIYAVKSSGGVAGLVASSAAPATGPTGYTAWREVARCRTLSSAATLAAIVNKVGGTSAGAGSSEWTSYTPTLNGGLTASFNTSYYRRVGSTLEIRGSLTASNTGSTTALKASIPSPGLTIDTTKVSRAAGNTNNLGTGYWYNATTTESLEIYFNDTTSFSFNRRGTNGSDINADNLVSGHRIDWLLSIPISEFAGLYI